MRVFVVVPPAPVVTLDQAKTHLEVEHGEHDTIITGMIAAATGHIDGPNGWLGRCIGVQTLEARFGSTVCSAVRLPFPPVINLAGVKYLGVDRVEHTADVDGFELYGDELVPIAAWPWSGGSTGREAVRVQYRAGYPTVPGAIVAAILLMVGDLYRFRDSVSGGADVQAAISRTVANLLDPFRVFA